MRQPNRRAVAARYFAAVGALLHAYADVLTADAVCVVAEHRPGDDDDAPAALAAAVALLIGRLAEPPNPTTGGRP